MTDLERLVSAYCETHSGPRDADWLVDFARAVVIQLTPIPDQWPIPTSELVTAARQAVAENDSTLGDWYFDGLNEQSSLGDWYFGNDSSGPITSLAGKITGKQPDQIDFSKWPDLELKAEQDPPELQLDDSFWDEWAKQKRSQA